MRTALALLAVLLCATEALAGGAANAVGAPALSPLIFAGAALGVTAYGLYRKKRRK